MAQVGLTQATQSMFNIFFFFSVNINLRIVLYFFFFCEKQKVYILKALLSVIMGSNTVAYSPLGKQIDSADELADGIVTEAKLAANAVTVTKIKDNAVETAKIKDAQVTAPKLSGFTNLEYVDSDLTQGSIASSVTETTIANVVIPAATVTTGVLIIASLFGRAQASASNGSTFKLKTGVAASEAERESFVISKIADEQHGGCIAWYDSVANYAAEVSVIITGQNSDNHSNSITRCHSMVVFGH